MTSREFAGWLAFLRAEHLDVEHQDRRFGELWAVVASAVRDTKKRSKPYVWTDLFPEHRRAVRRDSLAEARAMFREGMAIGGALGFVPVKAKGR